MKPRVLADYGDLCGECPIWDVAQQTLYWTDCVGQQLHRYRDGKHETIKRGLEINGYRLNEAGGFIIGNNSGIWWWDGADVVKPIATEVEGCKCQMNDITADPAGRFIGGTNYYTTEGGYPLGKLVQIDTDGRASIIDEGIQLSNGFGFSPDGRTMYFTDSAAHKIYAYDYDPATGAARNRRVFVDVPVAEGVPDGLSVDQQGFVWSAQWFGSNVVRYDPDGREERRIALPAKQTSSLTFGGPEMTDIFITSAGRSEAMPEMPPGYDAVNGHFGGELFTLNLGIVGKPEFRTRLRIP